MIDKIIPYENQKLFRENVIQPNFDYEIQLIRRSITFLMKVIKVTRQKIHESSVLLEAF